MKRPTVSDLEGRLARRTRFNVSFSCSHDGVFCMIV